MKKLTPKGVLGGCGLKFAFDRSMKTKCPKCSKYRLKNPYRARIIRKGVFFRKSDGQRVTRFWCKHCEITFSTATQNACARQKKRHVNETIRRLLAGGMSQREVARVLGLNKKTVVRKFLFIAARERERLKRFNKRCVVASEVEFDDLETFEHTKCKPLSVTLMVEYKTRRIIDFQVSQMPAKGRLTKLALKKYGYRKDYRKQGRALLFERTQSLIAKDAVIRSDSNPHYAPDVKEYFPKALHQTVLGGRGASTGQGELKKLKWDPIFSLNHTCAMWRANINRLFRKTWCTTKRRERLADHLAIYSMSHNLRLSTG